jgi:endoglycosylceramidase
VSRQHRWGTALAAVAVLVAALVANRPALAAPDNVDASAIRHAGRWLTARDGRVVIVHGVNMVAKSPPAYPSSVGFDDDDAAFLAASGFNAVRVGVERYAVEPSPGQFDDAYVAHIGETVDVLARHGVLALLDFHQDEFGPVFHDNGFPPWMTQTDGLPNLYQLGFPAQYAANPALERAFDHLWANSSDARGRPLQVDDAEILARVAQRMRGKTNLLGYEVMNEPWPGTATPTCLIPLVGCPLFDGGPFSHYYRVVMPAVRKADPTHLIWYEPNQIFNFGVQTRVKPPADRQRGFAFHDYGLTTASPQIPSDPTHFLFTVEDQLVVQNAIAHVKRTGDALLETEFGATTNADTLNQLVNLYDGSMIPWMFWSYDEDIVRHGADGKLLSPTAPGATTNALAALVRPYPQLIAGTPRAYDFDPASRLFTLRYVTAKASGRGRFGAGAETDIAVPAAVYSHGYDVGVTGGRVVSSAGAPVLRIAADRGARTVTVIVTPR